MESITKSNQSIEYIDFLIPFGPHARISNPADLMRKLFARNACQQIAGTQRHSDCPNLRRETLTPNEPHEPGEKEPRENDRARCEYAWPRPLQTWPRPLQTWPRPLQTWPRPLQRCVESAKIPRRGPQKTSGRLPSKRKVITR
ncbi:hypothetical protein [Breoghania corrubedonensis]|uniref:hypothetical protein n=1 Tax=Breoghania corrubedonensis TaxID=665038 RepID=UPI0011B21A8B|nr:hypothetical protein [Breoghania corrubedonensis]